MLDGIYLKHRIGIGDAVQFSSIPENFFQSTGHFLIDFSRHWVFDKNPYVLRDVPSFQRKVEVKHLWQDFISKKMPEPDLNGCYYSNASFHAKSIGVGALITRPRLYYPNRPPIPGRVLIHPQGISHPKLKGEVREGLARKYPHAFQIGLPTDDPIRELQYLPTPTREDLIREISQCETLIGMHSGPAWIAACFPNIKIKVLFGAWFEENALKNRTPLWSGNLDCIFDDPTLFEFYNQTDRNIGYTKSWLEI